MVVAIATKNTPVQDIALKGFILIDGAFMLLIVRTHKRLTLPAILIVIPVILIPAILIPAILMMAVATEAEEFTLTSMEE